MSNGYESNRYAFHNDNHKSTNSNYYPHMNNVSFQFPDTSENLSESSASFNPLGGDASYPQDPFVSFSSPRSRRDDEFCSREFRMRGDLINMNSYSPRDLPVGGNSYYSNPYGLGRFQPGTQMDEVNPYLPMTSHYREFLSHEGSTRMASVNMHHHRSRYPDYESRGSHSMIAHQELCYSSNSHPFSVQERDPSFLSPTMSDDIFRTSTPYYEKSKPKTVRSNNSRPNRQSEGNSYESSEIGGGCKARNTQHRKKKNKKGKDRKDAGDWDEDGTTIQMIRKEIEENRGNLMSMAVQQQGCRHLQLAIEQDGMEVVDLIYHELGTRLVLLMTDPFGNYLFQELIEVSTEQQLHSLVQALKKSLRNTSKDCHGTRCVQKLIQVCANSDCIDIILDGLCPYVVELSSDINGNHVIKQCMTVGDVSQRERLIDVIIDHCIEISKAVYGCCVVQKCIELASGTQHDRLLSCIENHSVELMTHPSGNYVLQYLMEHSPVEESDHFCRCVLGHVEELSKDKCSSNVLEKSLQLGSEETRDLIIEEIVNAEDLLSLLLDNFANYVVQRAALLSNEKQRDRMRSVILPFVKELSEHKVGKYILAKIQDYPE